MPKQKTINKEIEEEILKEFNEWKQKKIKELGNKWTEENMMNQIASKYLISLAFQKSRQKALKEELEILEKICSYMKQFNKDLVSDMNKRQAINDFNEVMKNFIGEKIKQIKKELGEEKK